MNMKYCKEYLNMDHPLLNADLSDIINESTNIVIDLDTRNTRSRYNRRRYIYHQIMCLLFFNYILSRKTNLKVWNLKVIVSFSFFFFPKFNPEEYDG